MSGEDLGPIVADLDSHARYLSKLRSELDQSERIREAMARIICPRHGFARAACPGCAADIAMIAEPRP